ncbi:hypothetical protein GCM10007853_04400 [Algimonas ampicilliniresistens]|uniref:XRE family transcriptional regulator n=2 Tax=Algimonas ampicilliniresistens TaxID=1298735 RepID=A0ABQ5V7K2_9PROT|nr:hypothetical protein GCM10007853_04400 [Algimonas ampicilliniresistens]
MSKRDDVIDDFCVETDLSPAVLQTFIARHPEYIEELLELYHEFAILELDLMDAHDASETSQAVLETQMTQKAYNALFGAEVRTFSKDIRLPRGFLTGLNSSVIELRSVPLNFLKAMAARLDVGLADLWSAMVQGNRQAIAMKSDDKPGGAKPISFDEYINRATLTSEQEKVLSHMMSDDGPN